MELIHLATGHAFDVLGSIAIVASLLFTAVELKHVVKAQRIGNQLAITRQHREIWSQLFDHPELKRVLNPKANLTESPVTPEESFFVTFVILHLDTVFKASSVGMLLPAESTEVDIAEFFALPIPKFVWSKSRALQDAKFVEFVEKSFVSSGKRFGQGSAE